MTKRIATTVLLALGLSLGAAAPAEARWVRVPETSCAKWVDDVKWKTKKTAKARAKAKARADRKRARAYARNGGERFYCPAHWSDN